MIVAAGPYVYYSILINNAAVEHPKEGYRFSKITDFWMSAVGAVVSVFLKKVMPQFFQPLFAKIVKESDDEEYKLKHTWKGAQATWDMIQYIVISVWGFIVLKYHSKILPWYMGGDQTMEAAFVALYEGCPFVDQSWPVYVWFLTTQGIYYGETVKHVFFEERGKGWMEFFIHHLATCFLVFASTMSNFIYYGAIIHYLHCTSDIAVMLVKGLGSTYYDTFTAVVFAAVHMPSWAFWRLFCLPVIIWGIYTHSDFSYKDPIFAPYDRFIAWNGHYLTILYILHWYWFFLFVKMIYNALTTGVSEDIQESAEDGRFNKGEEASPTGKAKND